LPFQGKLGDRLEAISMRPAHAVLLVCAVSVAATLVAQKPVRPRPKVAWTQPISSPSFGAAAVADIDDDGRLEVAFGTYFGDNSVRVLNGEDGSEYWRYNAGNACLDASLRFVDLDKDGKLELVVPVSNKGWVLAFDAKSGDELWRYGTHPIECTDTPPAILDADGDGELEVVYGTFKGRLHVIAGKTGAKKRVYDVVSHYVQTGPIVHDLNGDGTKDYVCATFKGDNRVYAVDGKSGQELWHFDVPGKHMGMYHGCSIGNVTGDQDPELVIAAYDGKVYCLRAKDGQELWAAQPVDRYFMSPTVLVDVNLDGKLEVVVVSERATVIRGDGKILWSKPATTGGGDSVTRGASIADLDGDRKPDIATLSGMGMFRVFRARDGKLLYEFDAAKLAGQPIRSSSHGVTIADLTGDGKLDVFFVVGATRPKKHGLAVCLTGFRGSGRGWYMLRHDPANTGNTGTSLDKTLLGRIENLTPAAKAVMRPARAPRHKVSSNPPPTGRRRPSKLNREQLLELAAKRGIPDKVMEAAVAANVYPPNKQLVDALGEHGKHSFEATCLLIETGHAHTQTVQLLRATYRAGDEKRLRALVDGPDLPNYGKWTALRGLGLADTKETRSYLLGRLGREKDAGYFMSIAEALAMLKEARATEIIAMQVLEFEPLWSGVEPYLLASLEKLGGRTAISCFVKYLEDTRGKNFVTALRYLQKLDEIKATDQARKLLAAERARSMSAQQRRALQRIAGDG